jgi:hypothetical protein
MYFSLGDNQVEDQLNDAMTQLAAESLRADNAEQALDAATVEIEDLKGKLRAEKAGHEALQKERADVNIEKLKLENASLKKQVQAQDKARKDYAANEPARVREAVRARVELERQAAEVLGDERLDEYTDRQVMIKVIERLDAPVEANAADAFVSGCFKTLVKNRAQGVAAMARVREITERAPATEERRDNRSARERFLDRQNNLAFEKESR